MEWKKTDMGLLRKCGEGFREGWELLMEKYGPYSVLCIKKEKLKKRKSQSGSAWPGLAWSSPATWLLLGAADAWQMAGWCAVRFQLFFSFSWLCFSSNMIVSSQVHTWQNRARFSLKCPESLSLFLFFSFIKEQSQTYCGNGTENHDPHGQKSVQTAPNRYSPSFGDVASATSSSSLTLNIKCVFFIVFVRAHISRQVFSQLHHEPWTLLYMDM